jgi:hypothetical protein
MKSHQKELAIIRRKKFAINLSLKDLCCIWKMIGRADISVYDFFQNVIEDIVHSYISMDDNHQVEKYLGTSDRKTLLRFLYERDIFEKTIGNWEALQQMKNEIKDAKKRKLRYSKKEVKETSEYIVYWQNCFDDLYAEYILWAEEGRTLEEEMEHVVSWAEEMLSFSRCVSLKKNIS